MNATITTAAPSHRWHGANTAYMSAALMRAVDRVAAAYATGETVYLQTHTAGYVHGVITAQHLDRHGYAAVTVRTSGGFDVEEMAHGVDTLAGLVERSREAFDTDRSFQHGYGYGVPFALAACGRCGHTWWPVPGYNGAGVPADGLCVDCRDGYTPDLFQDAPHGELQGIVDYEERTREEGDYLDALYADYDGYGPDAD